MSLQKKNLGLNGDGTLPEVPVIKMLAEGSNWKNKLKWKVS